MRIIIVDDEVNALEMFLRQIVMKQAVDYRFFKDEPSQILPYVVEHDVDGAFLDIMMPGINGFDLAAKLIKARPNIKIVFVTGLDVKMEDIPSDIRENCIGIMYKPYDLAELEKHLYSISLVRPMLKVTTFGSFDCFINGHLVSFSSSKSKELFALLIILKGKSISMGETIALLWPDKDVEKAKKLYRDAVWRLRETLKDIDFQCVNFGRAQLSVNTKDIDCDYYKYLSSQEIYYGGDFLISYEWSMPYQMELDDISYRREQEQENPPK